MSQVNEAVLADYARRGLRAPLPQREVHVFHHDRTGTPDDGGAVEKALATPQP